MSYPVKILPNENYKSIECDLSDHFLIRYIPMHNVNVLKDLIEPITGHIKQSYVFSPKERAQDLSTRLLGVFEISHLKIDLTKSGKGKYNEYCQPECKVSPPVFEEDYVINNDRHFWVLLISEINNIKVDFTKSNMPFKAICRVQHSPMKWNYWHFSVRWETDDGMWHELPDNEKKKKWSNRLAHEVRTLIAMYAKIEEPNYSELDKSCYIKPA
jgi:hypothetical protein